MLMQTVVLPYGKGTEVLHIPKENLAGIITIPSKKTIDGGKTQEEIVKEALDNPISSKRLSELSVNRKNIVVITSDHTRAVPSAITMPLLLKEIRKGSPDARITILIATGLHRGMTEEEKLARFGKEIVSRETIVNHDAFKKDGCAYLGQLPSGSKCEIDRIAVDADLLVAEGFIEPHFFAGFSGGRKSILPGIASATCVNINHSSVQMADPRSTTGVLDGNPIHEDMACAARMAHLAFILNVLLDEKKEIVQAYAGDEEKAHREGCMRLLANNGVPSIPADIVVTTNGGFPLDQNLYQCPKGLASAVECVNEQGVIILVASCNEGLGGEHFATLMQSGSPKELQARILATSPEKTIPEQWCVQRFTGTLMNHPIILVSSLAKETVEKMGFVYAKTADEALLEAFRMKGKDASVTVIPDGVSVIVKRRKRI